MFISPSYVYKDVILQMSCKGLLKQTLLGFIGHSPLLEFRYLIKSTSKQTILVQF